jgi:hypothetical protein
MFIRAKSARSNTRAKSRHT